VKIENAFLVEGVALDIRGAMTLVGFNQRVVAPPSLPSAFRQTLMLSLIDEVGPEAVPEGSIAGQLGLTLVDPGGVTAFAFTQGVPLQPKQRPELPTYTNIAIEIPFSCNSYGVYALTIKWHLAGADVEERQIDVLVLDPQDAGEMGSK
jgi:hypothetical protein